MHAAKQCIEFTEVDGAYVQDAHPELRQLFLFCVIFIRLRLGAQVRIVVTSVMRTYGVHGARRGLDFLVESNTAMTTDLEIIRTLLTLKNLVNLLFPYTKSNGTPGHTMVYRMRSGNGSDSEHRKHAHLQRPVKGWAGEPKELPL